MDDIKKTFAYIHKEYVKPIYNNKYVNTIYTNIQKMDGFVIIGIIVCICFIFLSNNRICAYKHASEEIEGQILNIENIGSREEPNYKTEVSYNIDDKSHTKVLYSPGRRIIGGSVNLKYSKNNPENILIKSDIVDQISFCVCCSIVGIAIAIGGFIRQILD